MNCYVTSMRAIFKKSEKCSIADNQWHATPPPALPLSQGEGSRAHKPIMWWSDCTMQTDNLRSVLTKKQSRIFFLPLWSIRPHKPYQNLRPRDSGLCFIRILKAKSGSREPSPRSWDACREAMNVARKLTIPSLLSMIPFKTLLSLLPIYRWRQKAIWA